MTKKDAIDWKQHPVTQEVFRLLRERIQSLEQELGMSAGIDPLKDRYLVGAIAAHKDVILLDFDFQGETNE